MKKTIATVKLVLLLFFPMLALNHAMAGKFYKCGKQTIVTWLSSDFGSEKKLVLAPSSVMDGTSFEWRCLTNFPAQAMHLSGNQLCESRTSY
jgi:hypothetical protein